MTHRTLSMTLLAVFALIAGAAAHEGHRHQAMGTVEAIDAEEITLAMEEDKSESFKLTDETSFTRGEEEVTREEMTVGERAVVMYEKKDKINVAIEIKLSPRKTER